MQKFFCGRHFIIYIYIIYKIQFFNQILLFNNLYIYYLYFIIYMLFIFFIFKHFSKKLKIFLIGNSIFSFI